MSIRVEQLRLAIAAFDRGDLMEAASVLEKSDHPIDRENAVNCRNLAVGGAAHMVQTLGYLLRQHVEMAEMLTRAASIDQRCSKSTFLSVCMCATARNSEPPPPNS
jgi:hypothetical protein